MPNKLVSHGEESLRRLETLAEHRVVDHAVSVFDEHERNAMRVALRSVGRSDTPLTAARARDVKLELLRAQTHTARAVSGVVGGALGEMHTESLRGIQQVLSVFEKGKRTPLDDPAVFARLTRARVFPRQEEARRYLASWSGEAAVRFTQIVDSSVAAGHTVGMLADRLEQHIESERARVVRIARTESAYSYNAAQDDAIVVLKEVYPDVMKRWVEHVSDSTWQPLDNKVANDSMAMHGQVTAPGGSFTMPPAENVDSRMWGSSWSFPPNRPNDRGVVVVWRAQWKVPGWVWENGTKRWIVKR